MDMFRINVKEFCLIVTFKKNDFFNAAPCIHIKYLRLGHENFA